MTPEQIRHWESKGWRVVVAPGGTEIPIDGPTLVIEEATGAQYFVDPAKWGMRLRRLENGLMGAPELVKP